MAWPAVHYDDLWADWETEVFRGDRWLPPDEPAERTIHTSWALGFSTVSWRHGSLMYHVDFYHMTMDVHDLDRVRDRVSPSLPLRFRRVGEGRVMPWPIGMDMTIINEYSRHEMEILAGTAESVIFGSSLRLRDLGLVTWLPTFDCVAYIDWTLGRLHFLPVNHARLPPQTLSWRVRFLLAGGGVLPERDTDSD